jgi:hypothetical protein
MLNRKLNVEEDFQLISEELVKLFTPNYLDNVARKVSFLQRCSKFKPTDFISLCGFFNHQSGTKSLGQLCGILESKRNVSLTAEGLNQRFNDSGVSLLREVFRKLLSKHFMSFTIPIQYQLDIRRLRILDSTAFELPVTYLEKYKGYHKSGVRIQLEYELLKGEFLHLEVQNGRESDNTFGQTLIDTIQKYDLVIRDLGYLSFKELAEIHQRNAYYISRLKTNIINYVRKDTGSYIKLNLDKIMGEMEIGEVREIKNIYVGKEKMNIPRLILCKLTDEQTEQRRKRLQKKEIKKGVKVSHQTQKLSRLNMFISNIPYQSVPKEEIQPFYSLRWQIEILFKTWKSLFKIHEVKKMKMERFECHLYGTLISLLITSTFAFKIRELLYLKKKKEISELKAIYIVREFLSTLHQAILEGMDSLLLKIERMFVQVEKNGKKAHRFKKKTPFDILGVVYEESNKATA